MDKIRIYLQSYDHKLLDQSAKKIAEVAKKNGSELAGPLPLPTKIKKYTVLRSVHVNKDSREQFEMRIHRRFVEIKNSSQQIVNALASLNLPEGVEMVMPGDNIEMTVELIHPIAMEEGLRFAIREGGRTVASGVVATITK